MPDHPLDIQTHPKHLTLIALSIKKHITLCVQNTLYLIVYQGKPHEPHCSGSLFLLVFEYFQKLKCVYEQKFRLK
jgi:hypothetical protein